MNSDRFASALCGRGWHTAGLLLVLAVFLKSSALGADGTVKGEVFIVTKGAINIRLGLVEVFGFPEEVIQKHIAERNAHIKDEMPDFDGQIKLRDEFIAKVKTVIEELKKLHEEKRQLDRKFGKVISLTELRKR